MVESQCFMKIEIASEQPSEGCPIGSYGCKAENCSNTCFCEDHCSWKMCKLKEQDMPPKSCIAHTDLKWHFDQQKNYWRAKKEGIDGNILKITKLVLSGVSCHWNPFCF